MRAALDGRRNRRFSSPAAIGRSRTTESFETFPACRIDCGSCRPRHVCSPVSVLSDMGMIRFRRKAGRIRDDLYDASSTKGRIANADGAGRFENRMRRRSLPRWSRSWSSLSGSHGLGDVVGPGLHHASPAFEQVAAEISSFDAANRVGQRRLRDLPGLAGICAPVPERTPETMWNRLNSQLHEQFAKSLIGQRLALWRRKHQTGSIRKFLRHLQQLHRYRAQLDVMFLRRFHPFCRDRPDSTP